jgi:hypothetical protein
MPFDGVFHFLIEFGDGVDWFGRLEVAVLGGVAKRDVHILVSAICKWITRRWGWA